MNRLVLLAFLLASAAAWADDAPPTIRICDSSGCSDRPRDSATFQPEATDPVAEQRLAALTDLAGKDPRAAYDLGLRYFRGDGVEKNSYLALEWMRKAGDSGDFKAQQALGRFYLAGLEEMGPDPVEAEHWLSLAADRGDKEAKKLLVQARSAKKDEQALYQWRETYRKNGSWGWYSGYPYRSYWRAGRWYFY